MFGKTLHGYGQFRFEEKLKAPRIWLQWNLGSNRSSVILENALMKEATWDKKR